MEFDVIGLYMPEDDVIPFNARLSGRCGHNLYLKNAQKAMSTAKTTPVTFSSARKSPVWAPCRKYASRVTITKGNSALQCDDDITNLEFINLDIIQ